MKNLSDFIEQPYLGEGAVKNSKKRKRFNPARDLFNTNNRSVSNQQNQNKKLMRILERYELDKPILMHDKLEIIWQNSKKESSPCADSEIDHLTFIEVRHKLNLIKASRSVTNKKQAHAYNLMLLLLEDRNQKAKEQNTRRLFVHEKEREFFDCLRIIIQNGYALVP